MRLAVEERSRNGGRHQRVDVVPKVVLVDEKELGSVERHAHEILLHGVSRPRIDLEVEAERRGHPAQRDVLGERGHLGKFAVVGDTSEPEPAQPAPLAPCRRFAGIGLSHTAELQITEGCSEIRRGLAPVRIVRRRIGCLEATVDDAFGTLRESRSRIESEERTQEEARQSDRERARSERPRRPPGVAPRRRIHPGRPHTRTLSRVWQHSSGLALRRVPSPSMAERRQGGNIPVPPARSPAA